MIFFYQFLALGMMLLGMYLDKPYEPFVAAIIIIGAIIVKK